MSTIVHAFVTVSQTAPHTQVCFTIITPPFFTNKIPTDYVMSLTLNMVLVFKRLSIAYICNAIIILSGQLIAPSNYGSNF